MGNRNREHAVGIAVEILRTKKRDPGDARLFGLRDDFLFFAPLKSSKSAADQKLLASIWAEAKALAAD